MKLLFFLSVATISSLFLAGCRDDEYRGSSYGRAGVYYDDDYGYDGGSFGYGGYDGGYYSPSYTETIYVEGRPYRYDDSDRLYYVSSGRRVYMTDAQYSRNRRAIAEYRAKAKVMENRQKIEYSQNRQEIDRYRAEQELRQRQTQANYAVQRNRYEYEQKLQSNRASARQAAYRSDLQQQKKEWEWKQKQNEAQSRAAVAKWKYEQGSSSKKKKNDDD